MSFAPCDYCQDCPCTCGPGYPGHSVPESTDTNPYRAKRKCEEVSCLDGLFPNGKKCPICTDGTLPSCAERLPGVFSHPEFTSMLSQDNSVIQLRLDRGAAIEYLAKSIHHEARPRVRLGSFDLVAALYPVDDTHLAALVHRCKDAQEKK